MINPSTDYGRARSKRVEDKMGTDGVVANKRTKEYLDSQQIIKVNRMRANDRNYMIARGKWNSGTITQDARMQTTYTIEGIEVYEELSRASKAGDIFAYNVLGHPLVLHIDDCTIVVEEDRSSTKLHAINKSKKKRMVSLTKLERLFKI